MILLHAIKLYVSQFGKIYIYDQSFGVVCVCIAIVPWFMELNSYRAGCKYFVKPLRPVLDIINSSDHLAVSEAKIISLLPWERYFIYFLIRYLFFFSIFGRNEYSNSCFSWKLKIRTILCQIIKLFWCVQHLN